jgi:hypothetical protein
MHRAPASAPGASEAIFSSQVRRAVPYKFLFGSGYAGFGL